MRSLEGRELDGSGVGLRQRITFEEAIPLYRTSPAYATGGEGYNLALATGMLAEIVELSGDPHQTARPGSADKCVFDGSASASK